MMKIYLEAFHSSLECINRINLCDNDSAAKSFQRLGGTFSNITVTSNNGAFTRQHDVSSSLDTVDE